MPSVWDGEGKGYTKNCDGCPFYRTVRDGDETLEVCGWGIAFKFLYRGEKRRVCELLGRDQPEDPSLKYIDGKMSIVIENWRKKKAKEEEKPRALELKLK